ncbi:LAFA_0G00276g1_1 [Lachancea sp. 'fantastica']|nr:LAFA_0G00276g1_1 [Lachancea sp. 'fantastica']
MHALPISSLLNSSEPALVLNLCSKIYLEEWYLANSSHPYLGSSEARVISEKTGLTLRQVKNWVSNRRRKSKKHRIEPLLSHLLNKS